MMDCECDLEWRLNNIDIYLTSLIFLKKLPS